MELAAIQLARIVQFSELNELDPRGRIRFVDVVPALVEHYGFQKYPQKHDDLDEAKGIEFIDGKLKDKNITKLVLYNSALVVETRSSTRDSEQILTNRYRGRPDNWNRTGSEEHHSTTTAASICE